MTTMRRLCRATGWRGRARSIRCSGRERHGQNAKSGREQRECAITLSRHCRARPRRVRDPGRHASEYGHSRAVRLQRRGSRSHGVDYTDSGRLRRGSSADYADYADTVFEERIGPVKGAAMLSGAPCNAGQPDDEAAAARRSSTEAGFDIADTQQSASKPLLKNIIRLICVICG
jgi:hypothetical protein